MIISEIQSDIQSIEEDAALCKEINFNKRSEAIDFIDFHILDRIESLLQKSDLKTELNKLKQRAEKIKCTLEKIDTNLFRKIREKISTGICIKSSFKKMIHQHLGQDVIDICQQDKIGYDNLDVFINGLLSDRPIPETTIMRSPEMIFYQKTPARIIFEMIDLAEIKPDDVFFDLGSGLGQAVILVNLISGATAIGIEYEPAFCNYAKACASQLNLSNVEFIHAEACSCDYSQGTIFFMYTPFEGGMLQDMLDILKKESQKRAIKVFTYGPCSAHVARQGWLNCVNGNSDNPYKLYEFRSSSAVGF